MILAWLQESLYKHIPRNVAELIDLAWLQASLYKNISMKGIRTHLFWHGYKHHIPMKCSRTDWFWHGYKHHCTNTFQRNVADQIDFGMATSIITQTHFYEMQQNSIILALLQASLYKHISKNVAELIEFGMFTSIITQTHF